MDTSAREAAVRLQEADTLIRPPLKEDGRGSNGFNVVSALDIGDSNKRRVLQTLFDRGPTSRAELARISGAMRTTISGIVQPLIEAGLLVEVAATQSAGVGKPARPLWFSPDTAPVCAVSLMPNLIETCMVSLRGEVYGQRTEILSGQIVSREHYLASLNRCIHDTLLSARAKPLGIGVAVDAMVDAVSGLIIKMDRAPWLAGLELARILEEQFTLPTAIDHLPRAISMGERWFGKGRELKNFAIIYAGEGLACSLFFEGEAFRGPHGSGGELGHTIVSTQGEYCICGRQGCWETIASLRWLRREAERIGLPDPESITVPWLCEMATDNNVVDLLLNDYAYNLAVGIANLQTLLMPGNFIIYGDVARGSDTFLGKIKTKVSELAFRHPDQVIEIAFGEEDQRSMTLRGAAGLVIGEQLRIRY